MKRLSFFLLPLALLFLFLLPSSKAQAGQWFTEICSSEGGFDGIPGVSRRNLTDPLQGLPAGLSTLECGWRTGYAIGNNYSKRFFGLEQKESIAHKASLSWYWEELPEATLFQTPDFVPGDIYLRARNGTRACLWVNTEFEEKLAYSCVAKGGVVTSSKYGKLLRPARNIVVKKNKRGKIISRSGFYNIVPSTLNSINDIVFGTRAYNISFGLGLWCLSRSGCSAKQKPQIIWQALRFRNKDVLPPFINPDGYMALEFPETVPDPNPLVQVALDNDNSLAGEIKCPLREEEECIATYGSQMIGATDQPLLDKGAGIYSLTLENNSSDGSASGPFSGATLNGSDAYGWLLGPNGSLYNRCSTSGFASVCAPPPWGLLNFELRSEINDTSYNLNGPNRLRVCAQDRFQPSPGSANEAGLNTCVTANNSFVLDNEGPFGDITLPADQGTSPYSGTIPFTAAVEDTALGVASVQFQVQETDFLGNPIGPVTSVGPLLDSPTAAGVLGTYTTNIDTTLLPNGIYRVLAVAQDKEARTLGAMSESSYETVLESNYLVYINN